MNEYLCPFDFFQLGLLLAVHASILLMNADWSGMDLREDCPSKFIYIYIYIQYIFRSAKVTQNLP